MGRISLLAGKLLLASLTLIAAGTGVAANAKASARLDPSFGTGGKVFLPGSVNEDYRGWQGPGIAQVLDDGRVLFPLEGRVVALLPSGEVDLNFGEAGSIAPKAPAGHGAGLHAFTVDSLGRPILVGSISPLGAKAGPLSGDDPSEALVQRFTGDGQLDPSFGGGDGTLTADFGLPPGEPGLDPDIGATLAVIDGSGRIVIGGQRAAKKLYGGKGSFIRDHEAFLARLTSAGEVDMTFASEGVLPLPESARAGRIFTEPAGGLLAVGWRGEEGNLIRLDPNGRFDPAFGEKGGRPVPSAVWGGEAMAPLALDGAGGLLLGAGLPGWGDRYSPRRLAFKRLLPDGSLDRDYGHRGLLTFRFPLLKTARVAVDRKGRFLVAMALGKRGPRPRGESPAPTELALARLRADGSLDRRFGRAGVLPILSSGNLNLYLDDLTLQGDRRALIQLDRCGERCRTTLVRIDLGP